MFKQRHNEQLRVFAMRDIIRQGIAIFVESREIGCANSAFLSPENSGDSYTPDNKPRNGSTAEFREQKSEFMAPSLMVITEESAQRLMDSLYEAGISPKYERASAGELQATREHLQDMQKAYSKLLEKL